MLEKMNEFRCLSCNKLIFKYKLKGSLKVQVKCARCGCISNLILERGVKTDE